MKLQSQISRKYKNKEYKKSWLVISSKILKVLKWKTGQNLKAVIRGGKLVITKKGT